MTSKENIVEDIPLKDLEVSLKENENQEISVQGIQMEIKCLKESHQKEISNLKETMLQEMCTLKETISTMYLEIANCEYCGKHTNTCTSHRGAVHAFGTRNKTKPFPNNIQADPNGTQNYLGHPHYLSNRHIGATHITKSPNNTTTDFAHLRYVPPDTNYGADDVKDGPQTRENYSHNNNNDIKVIRKIPNNFKKVLPFSESNHKNIDPDNQGRASQNKNDKCILQIDLDKIHYYSNYPRQLDISNSVNSHCIYACEKPAQPDSVWTSYRDNFTIHGLSRVFTGRLWEKALWSIVLLASLLFVGYATHGFVQEYRSFRVKTDIQVISAKEITFPAITLCGDDSRNLAGKVK